MKKKASRNLLVFVLSAAIFCVAMGSALGESAEEKAPVELLVSAAASLTDVMPALTEAYALAAPHATLTFTYGSSGALRTQIEEGAPVDVFISASSKHMDALAEAGLLLPNSNRPLLENKVVLIVPDGSEQALTSFADVGMDTVNLVGIGEPSSVPAGQYAKQVFESLGIWELVSAKANFGTDVRQVLTWVEEGAVSSGVVYATDAITSDRVTVVAEAPEGSCDKIIYPAAAIVSTKQEEEALAFLSFLTAPEAIVIFESFGFSSTN